MVKSLKNMKINNENMYFASERKFFGILTIKLNGKMVKSMKNMKINNEHMYFASERSVRAEILWYFKH